MGTGVLLEAIDQSIRSGKKLTALTGVAPLVIIPYIDTPSEKEASRPQKKLYQWAVGAVLAFGFFLASVHFFYKPLDVLWFVILRKLGIG